jgi:hypothetical protein
MPNPAVTPQTSSCEWSRRIFEVKPTEVAARSLKWIEVRLRRFARIPRDAIFVYYI